MRWFLWSGLAALLLACVAVASSEGAPQAEARWVMRDLGTLGGPTSDAVAVNTRGQVVGTADTKRKGAYGSPVRHAFLWQHGKMRDLGTLGGPESWANDVNDRGQIVGGAYTKTRDRDGEPISHAFLWQRGKMRDLGTLGGPESVATLISERGWVIGYSDTKAVDPDSEIGSPASHAFLWVDGRMRDLGTLDGPNSGVAGINSRGQIVGWAETKAKAANGDPIQHAFLWENGRMRDLGTLGGPTSGVADINERGQIVGWADTKARDEDGFPISRAFLWANGKMHGIGPSTATRTIDSSASLINERGDVVGTVDDDTLIPVPGTPGAFTWEVTAFLWRNGTTTGLGSLGGKDIRPFALNNKAQIVGFAETGRDEQGNSIRHAFVWENGAIADLGTPGGQDSDASDINERGRIVGAAETKAGSDRVRSRAVLWTKAD